jgi:hypothetical protein
MVDGGYFENSGVATALDLHAALSELNKTHGFLARVIILHIGSGPGYKLGYDGLAEIFTPVRAILNTRGARGRNAVTQAEYFLNRNDNLSNRFTQDMRAFILDGGRFELPLGWHLAESSRALIREQSGIASRCKPTARNYNNTEVNDCIAWSVHQDLKISSQ